MILLASVLTWLDRVDQDLFRAVNGALHDLGAGAPELFLRFGNHWGNALVALPILLTAWVVRKEGRLRVLAEVGLALVLVWLVNGALKRTFERPRPMVTLSAEFAAGELGNSEGVRLEVNSMPSGHAATCFALVLVLLSWARGVADVGRRRLAYGALLGAGVHCAVARIYAGAHYPLDVLVGAAVGTACGLAAVLAVAVARRLAGPAPKAPAHAPVPALRVPS